jgi:hypothetical protein
LRTEAIVLAVTLLMGPLGAEAADVVVWWEKGFYGQENEAVAGSRGALPSLGSDGAVDLSDAASRQLDDRARGRPLGPVTLKGKGAIEAKAFET